MNRSQSSSTVRRSWAIVLSAALALSSSRCVADFVGSPGTPQPPPPPGAAQLAFSSQPSSAVAGTSIATALTVAIQDSLGRTITSASGSVTASLAGGKGAARLRGTTTVTATNGIATFTDLSVDSAGSGYTIAASSSGMTPTSSSAFNVTAGPAVRMGFIVQPSNTVAQRDITPAVRVALQDSLGNATNGPSTQVNLELLPDGGLFGAQLSGDRTRNTNNGIVTFSDLRVSMTGAGFTLRATSNDYAPATSQPFTISEPTDVSALAIRVQPSDAAAGRPIAPSIRVAAINSLGNTVTTSNAAITLSLVPGTGTVGATVRGTTTVNAINGEAVFADINFDSVGVGYRLLATSPALTEDTSLVFAVTAGATARLAFTVQPTTSTAGVAITPAPQVSILDAQGNVVTTATSTVALYITSGSGTPGATLNGPTSVAAVNGVAVFSNVSISAAGAGYTLTAAAPGLASDGSTAFAVTATAPGPVNTVTVAPPTASLASFTATQTFTAEARDALNQQIPGAAFTWTSSNTAVATVDGNGVATAVGNGTTTITASNGGKSGTATLTVNQVVVTINITPDSMTLTDGQTRDVVATALDALGKPVTRALAYAWSSDNATVTVTVDPSDSAKATIARTTGTSNANVTATTEGKSGVAHVK